MKRCGLTLAFLFLTTLTWGQTATGVAPFSSQKAGTFDSVNLGNLNVHFEVPIVNKAGRGLPFRYSLVYDSSVWIPKSVSGTMTWQPINQWWGWSANTQAAVGYITQRVTQRKCIPSGSGPSWYFYSVYTYTSYVDRSGVQHPFNLVLDDDSFGDCGTGRESGTATTTDGSGLKLSAIMGANSATITTPEGTMITAPVQINGAGTVRDDNGNKITTTTGTVFTDTIGTNALTISGTNPVLYSYLNPAGTSSAVKLNYASKAVRTNFGCNGIGQPETVAEYGPTTVSMVSSIELPDGSKYVINYEPTPGYSGYVTGRISSITLPTGGQISYSYPSPNGAIRCSDGSTAKLNRTESPGGTWAYSRALLSGSTWETTIYDPPTDEHPNGNKTTVTFQKATTPGSTTTTFLETKRVVNIGTSTVLQTVDTCYNINALSKCQLPPSFPIASITVTMRLPDTSGKTSERYTKFTSLGLPYEMGAYDFGNGGRGNLLRKTAITYDTTLGNGIYDRPSTIQVYDGSNTIRAQTNYTYDEGTPEPTSALQHDPISGSRGNATTVSRWVSGSNWLTQQFTYFDTGLIYTSKENGRDETKFTYTYGECENAFPTYVAVPMNLHRSAHWDCRGGVLLWSKDENDQQTSYTYDNLWRPDSKTDPLGNVTDFYYQPDATHPTPEVAWFLNFNGGSSVASDIQYRDGFGRTYSHQRSQGPNASMLDTVSYGYDANGRLTTTSLPCSVTWEATCPDIAVTQTYDALDRPLQAVDKGGGTVTYTYQGNDVLVAIGPAPSGENEKKKQLEYDALGRLTSVCELTSAANGGGNCAQTAPAIGYWTKYAYDVLGSLTEVRQNAQGTPQTRTYSYDALGRMTSESNPESLQVQTQYVYDSDTSGVTPTCSGTYKGDLVKRIDPAGNTTCYAYDALHRVTAITYPGGPNAPSTPEKHFVYDDSSVTYNGGPAVMQKTKGRLARAYTGPEGSKVTDLLYNYNERGEVVDVYQFTPHSGGYHKVTGTYWEHGLLKTQSQIKRATSVAGSETTVVGLPAITYAVDGQGRINTVSAGAVNLGTATFSPDGTISVPSGFLTKVNYGSGDSDSFTPDPDTGRLEQYKFSIDNQNVIGTLTWNPNGSLASLATTDPFNTANSQTCNYQHDDLSRVKSVDCGTSWYQSFSFDPFGNINKATRPESTGQSFLHQYSTATNRIADFPANAYDSNGNLTNDGVYSFEWDAEGKMRSVTSASTVTATYDALGRMVEQARGTSYTQILYGLGGQKLALLNGNTLAQAFIALPGGGTAVYTSSGLSRYRHADWLGSSRFASTPTSPTTKVYSGAYAPYGESYAESGTTDRSFTGQNQDTIAGLYDFMFREYNPVHGRWISPDPAGMAAADPANPQTWNLYAYVGNSPLDSVDPLGLLDCLVYIQRYRYDDHERLVPDGVEGLFCGGGGRSRSGQGMIPRGGAGRAPSGPGAPPANNKKLTPAQCQAARTLLEREAKWGTTIAAWQSAIGFGDGTVEPFNSSVPGNAYANTAAGTVKVDWFTDLRLTTLIPGPQVPAYIAGKLTWTGVRLATDAPVTNYLPFQDPVETRTMSLAVQGYGFSDLFTPAFMQENCQ